MVANPNNTPYTHEIDLRDDPAKVQSEMDAFLTGKLLPSDIEELKTLAIAQKNSKVDGLFLLRKDIYVDMKPQFDDSAWILTMFVGKDHVMLVKKESKEIPAQAPIPEEEKENIKANLNIL